MATVTPIYNDLAKITPPYEDCLTTAWYSSSSPPHDVSILSEGFSNASSSCDAQRGVINYSVVVFGGGEGHIFTPPKHEAKASANIKFDFTPTSTGNLKIEATLLVNAKTGAAAGSDTVIPDFLDVARTFLLPTQIDAFLTLAEELILESFGGVRNEAFLSVGGWQFSAGNHYDCRRSWSRWIFSSSAVVTE